MGAESDEEYYGRCENRGFWSKFYAYSEIIYGLEKFVVNNEFVMKQNPRISEYYRMCCDFIYIRISKP